MNYKKYWDNFNTEHYLNVLTERDMKEIEKQIEEENDFKERFLVLIGFIFLLACMVALFKALEFLY